MKVFQINIGTTTPKNKYTKLRTLFIKTEETEEDVQSAYMKKYELFTVNVSQVKEIKIFKKDNSVVLEEKIENESSIKEDKDYYYGFRYKAIIQKEDIGQEHYDFNSAKEVLQKEIVDLTKKFKETVEEKFGLKGLKDFQVYYDNISFKFKPSSFNFKKNNKILKNVKKHSEKNTLERSN